jgi:hypothetical protein
LDVHLKKDKGTSINDGEKLDVETDS